MWSIVLIMMEYKNSYILKMKYFLFQSPQKKRLPHSLICFYGDFPSLIFALDKQRRPRKVCTEERTSTNNDLQSLSFD